jgi:voltage-gated potassium channel Kch
MLRSLLYAFGLMALCVAVHASGLAAAFRWLDRQGDRPRPFLLWTRLLIGIAGWTILVHLVEIAAWALLYAWKDAMPDLPTALYFSAVTYTTTGYGDVVLPQEWRMIGAVEALTGILMCGWSTGFFFALVSRVHVSTKGSTEGTP